MCAGAWQKKIGGAGFKERANTQSGDVDVSPWEDPDRQPDTPSLIVFLIHFNFVK